MPKGYVIAHITVSDPETYKDYVHLNTPVLTALGGRYIVRGGQASCVEGTLNERHVVIEFDSYEAALTAYHDPDYQRIADIRRATASSQIIVVEGAS